jgi:hypothetical protein
MTESPVSLDGLISYVKTISPDGGPLQNLSDAVSVGSDLDEKSDALIGHFVDAARRLPREPLGQSWVNARLVVPRQPGVSHGDRLRGERASRAPPARCRKASRRRRSRLRRAAPRFRPGCKQR